MDLRLKAGTGGHKHNSHGKVCRKPQFVFSFSVKTFPLQLIMPLNECVRVCVCVGNAGLKKGFGTHQEP